MKNLSHTSVFSLLSVCMLLALITSCGKKQNNHLQIDDFISLNAQFNEPQKEYGTIPFFVWNSKITKEVIDDYMKDFKEANCGGVIIHPRPGLVNEYLSTEWYELFQYAVNKGKELGLNVWIYDENSYPSGFAGGHVPAEMPESYNQGQGLKMIKTEVLPDTASKFYLCLKEEKNGTLTDITATLKAETGKTGNYFLFSKTYFKKSDWFGGFSYVDLLYPGVTQKFIEITMKGYEKYIGADFGKTVPGNFTDEPEIGSPGGIRWTPDLFAVFQKKWGYDLKLNLPSLFDTVGNYPKIRHNYTQTLLQLFIDRWGKPWNEYCEKKGLQFTGHYWEHQWPSMTNGGDNMAMYAWHQTPAIDMLFNQFDETSPNAQFGNIRSVKELASVANQLGKHRTLSETYGGSGWDVTFNDMKRLGDWEYVLGVNLMNQHLSHSTLAGARKYDYPPSFSYHEPWWKDYKFLNQYYKRLSLALSSGKQVNDILILEPTTSAWLYDSYEKKGEKTTQIGKTFQAFVTKLEKSQVEYDLGSENIIKDHGSIKDNQFVVGKRNYSKIVIPPLTENLDVPTFELLETFVHNGGTILAFSSPTLLNGSPNNELKKLFGLNSKQVIKLDGLTDEIINKYFTNNILTFTEIKNGDLYHHRRSMKDGNVIFLANSSLTDSTIGNFIVKGKDAVEMNLFTGSIQDYPEKSLDGEISVAYAIPPAGSLLLYISDKKQEGYNLPKKSTIAQKITSKSPVAVSRIEDNSLMIDFCDLTLGGETTRDMHVFDAADKTFKYYGFVNGNPWNTSVQYKTNTVDRDTFGVKTGFEVTYHIKIEPNTAISDLKAVVERPNLWSVFVNGEKVTPIAGKWWLDRTFGVFAIGKALKTGDNNITLKASPMTIHSEIEPVYVLGNFSVEPASKGWVISTSKHEFTTGSWRRQGMPFYWQGIKYAKEYSIEKPANVYQVKLGDWKGTVAEVSVNGESAGIIGFAPYVLDISKFIKTGKNKVEVTIIGSLRNLLGPHHRNPAPGLASPWNWRFVPKYPSGNDYLMLDYGLMNDFELVEGN